MKEKISVDEVYSGDYIHEVADECKYAFKRKKQEAADIGTQAHSGIEEILRSTPAGSSVGVLLLSTGFFDDAVSPSAVQVGNCIAAAADWLHREEIIPILVERRIYSRRRGFSGTLDLLAEQKGRKVVVDWKSSKAIYPEYHLQTAAYVKAYEEETGDKVSGRILVRLGKSDGAFDVRELTSRAGLDSDYTAFLAAKKLYDWQQNNKK